MQSIDQVINRMKSMMVQIIDGTGHQGEKSPMYKDAKKVEKIVMDVRCGRSKVARLATADKTLAKWGF